MKTAKKFLLPFVLGAFLLSVNGGLVVNAANEDNLFSDVEYGHPYYDAIVYLRDSGNIDGYPDGTYGSGKEINRAEFTKIVVLAAGFEIPEDGCNYFPDVPVDEWYTPYICVAKDEGIIDGYEDGTFRPGDSVNFAEASKIAVNAMKLSLPEDEGGEWFAPYVLALDSYKAVPNSIVSFGQAFDRGEMAEMAWRILDQVSWKDSQSYYSISSGLAAKEAEGELITFDSCDQLGGYLEEASSNYNYGWFEDDIVFESEEGAVLPQDVPAASDSSESESVQKSADYSETNIQVAGVDEADIVKTDGDYIYLVSGKDVRVVKAYPVDEMVEMDKISFEGEFYPNEVYVDEDRLIVMGAAYEYVDYFLESEESMPVPDYSQLTEVYIYDISDKSDIGLLRHLAFEGYYSTSRKVDDMLYLVMNKYGYYYYEPDGPVLLEEDVLPLYSDSASGEVSAISSCGDVLYVPGGDSNDYMIVAAIPVDDATGVVTEQTVLGSSGDVYSSRENLYVAETRYNYWWYDETGDYEQTVIHKFGLGSDISYEGNGEVPGRALNQFSMDENDGYFRIATTSGWWNDSVNNVFVLNDELEVVGELTGLAPGEEIYSARFMGDRAYLVTFEQIDPLFVIGLSDPTNPTVLGELKIPGVSDYLHPIGENYLLGFGLDTAEPDVIEDAGWSWFQGIKVSIFDVSDVNNPQELHKMVIGDRGTSSELNYNHKALLFDEEKEILAFPVLLAEIPQAVKDNENLDLDAWVYGDYTFQGVYIFDVNVEDGFDYKGRISHYEEDELGDDFEYYYYYGEVKDDIDRILYIGNYFYTVGESMVKASGIEDLEEEARVVFE